MVLKSRILQFLPKKLIVELNDIARDVLISDNNSRINLMIAALDKYDVDYQELGSGTNRMAILIDGYVFKIALDKDGIRDNYAEFSMSQELQPFVVKVYECNGLVIVAEYVTVISKEEFQNSKDEVRHILSYLAQGYLLGDVGSINKNFMNWGYRDDESLVILDFAYIYRILGNEMVCGGLNKDDTTCTTMLEYDVNFDKLICPKCRKTYSFHDIRRKIDRDYEQRELDAIKKIAVKMTKPVQEVNMSIVQKIEDPDENNTNGGIEMSKKHKNKVSFEEDDNYQSYLDAISIMQENKPSDEPEQEQHPNVDIDAVDKIVQNITENESNIEESVVEDDETDETDDDSPIRNMEDARAILEADTTIADAAQEDIGMSNEEIEAGVKDAVEESDAFNAKMDVDSDEEENPVINNNADHDDDFYADPEETDLANRIDDDDAESQSVTTNETNKSVVATDGDTIIISNAVSTTEVSNTTIPVVSKANNRDTIILTTPDNVDKMRQMLANDIDEDDPYEKEYDQNSINNKRAKINRGKKQRNDF